MNIRYLIIFTFVLLIVPLTVRGQMLSIRPALVDSSDIIERALQENAGHASTTIEGAGSALVITYRTNEPLEVYMVPLAADDSYVPTDYMRFTLPMTEEGTATIDLTVTPGWSPADHRYLLNLLSRTEQADAAFTGMQFTPNSAGNSLGAAIRHLFTAEPFTPSSYHGLRGYRVMGTSVTVILGIVILLSCLISFALVKPERRASVLLLILVGGSFLYQLRFDSDLLRFTNEHLTEYLHGTYDEAGSAHQIATFIRTLTGEQPTTVYVCRDGTNFKEKLLRYFAYPIKISSEPEAAKSASIVLVMDKIHWSSDTTKAKTGLFQCGDFNGQAQKITTFPDGSVLLKPSATNT
jgi:hypothetical protein